MNETKPNATAEAMHHFRNWLYLLSADLATRVARGRGQDPEVHAAQQVDPEEVITVYLCLHAQYQAHQLALQALCMGMQPRQLALSRLLWNQERARAISDRR